MNVERGVCVHCGQKLNGLGVVVMVHPDTGREFGVAVCRPVGKRNAPHLAPLDCWSLVKYSLYELGSARRSADVAKFIQAEDFDAQLDALIEEILHDPRGAKGTSAP